MERLYENSALYVFLLEMGEVYEKLAALFKETPLPEGIRRLAERIAGSEAIGQEETPGEGYTENIPEIKDFGMFAGIKFGGSRWRLKGNDGTFRKF